MRSPFSGPGGGGCGACWRRPVWSAPSAASRGSGRVSLDQGLPPDQLLASPRDGLARLIPRDAHFAFFFFY